VVTFRDTVYVLSFHISIISLKQINKHDVYWDNRTSTLVYGENNYHFAETPMLFDQWVLEYNPNRPSNDDILRASLHASFKAHSSRHPRPANTATFDGWHEMMGHLYPEALRHLTEQCDGVVLTTNQLSDHKCEDCCLNDSKRVIYRAPTLQHPVPFWRLC
jgi:hypothetical protein